MKIKRFEQLEWGRFYDPETKAFLDEIFVDFLHPIGDEEPSISTNIKMGTNMMTSYLVQIPFKEGQSSKLHKVLNKIEECVSKTQEVISSIRHSIKLEKNEIRLSLWNSQ